MPVVIFFSAVVNVLYHFGVVQYFLIKIAWSINKLMKTSPTESVNSVANIFVGFVIPYLHFFFYILIRKYYIKQVFYVYSFKVRGTLTD